MQNAGETERLTSRARGQARSLSPGRMMEEDSKTKPSRSWALPVSFFIPSMFKIKLQDKSDVSAKKKFQVKVPTRMLIILALVFVVVPVLIFLYKEAHIHENHHEAHFKTKKFIGVDSKDTFKHFLDNRQNRTSSKSGASNDENEALKGEEVATNVTKTHLRHDTKTTHNATNVERINGDNRQLF